MGEIIFVTGGARSGKSRYAESLLKGMKKVLYVATAIPFDQEMEERIARHRERRPASWGTLEACEGLDKKLAAITDDREAIIVDCLTILVTNLLLKDPLTDWDHISPTEVDIIEENISEEINRLLIFLRNFSGMSIIVSNELGMGLVPEYPLGRFFRDIAGRINQRAAAEADRVYLTVSGIPVKIKG